MRRPLFLLAVGGLSLVMALLAAGAFWIERPSKLVVAISGRDTRDLSLMTAAGVLLKTGKHSTRLKIVQTDDAAAAAAAVDGNRADLAVVRPDIAMPARGQTVVILHRDVAVIVAPASGELHDMSDLAGHRVGMIGNGPGNDRLLETALAQYDMALDGIKIEALAPEEVVEALQSRRVDAIMVVDVLSGSVAKDVVKAVGEAGGGPPVFIPVPEAEAIAQRSPEYDATKIVRGTFGGAPPRPVDELDTLSVAVRLVANADVDQGAIGDLTRFFLTERGALAASVPIAQRIEAPSTDKGAPMPAHAGSAAYIDDSEETFFDKYSDMIYIGAMLLGVLASGATAVFSRLNAGRAAALDSAVARLVEILAQVRNATSSAALDRAQAEADGILATAVDGAGSRGDEGRFAMFGLALDQVRAAIRDRRDELARRASREQDAQPRMLAGE